MLIRVGKLLPNEYNRCLSRAHTTHAHFVHSYARTYIEPDDYKVSFVHEQKRHGLQWTWSIGVATVANKGTATVFVMLVGHDNSRHIYAQIFTD